MSWFSSLLPKSVAPATDALANQDARQPLLAPEPNLGGNVVKPFDAAAEKADLAKGDYAYRAVVAGGAVLFVGALALGVLGLVHAHGVNLPSQLTGPLNAMSTTHSWAFWTIGGMGAAGTLGLMIGVVKVRQSRKEAEASINRKEAAELAAARPEGGGDDAQGQQVKKDEARADSLIGTDEEDTRTQEEKLGLSKEHYAARNIRDEVRTEYEQMTPGTYLRQTFDEGEDQYRRITLKMGDDFIVSTSKISTQEDADALAAQLKGLGYKPKA